jgi:hypothetical protein
MCDASPQGQTVLVSVHTRIHKLHTVRTLVAATPATAAEGPQDTCSRRLKVHQTTCRHTPDAHQPTNHFKSRDLDHHGPVALMLIGHKTQWSTTLLHPQWNTRMCTDKVSQTASRPQPGCQQPPPPLPWSHAGGVCRIPILACLCCRFHARPPGLMQMPRPHNTASAAHRRVAAAAQWQYEQLPGPMQFLAFMRALLAALLLLLHLLTCLHQLLPSSSGPPPSSPTASLQPCFIGPLPGTSSQQKKQQALSKPPSTHSQAVKPTPKWQC